MGFHQQNKKLNKFNHKKIYLTIWHFLLLLKDKNKKPFKALIKKLNRFPLTKQKIKWNLTMKIF